MQSTQEWYANKITNIYKLSVKLKRYQALKLPQSLHLKRVLLRLCTHSASVEYVSKKYTNRADIIVKVALTRKVYVPCVAFAF